MESIISETFNYFQNKKFDIEYNKSSFVYTFKNSHMLPPVCSLLTYKNNSIFYFEDCIITIFSQFELRNGEQLILTDESNLIDLKITNFTLSLDSDHYFISNFNLEQMLLNEYKPYLKSSLFQNDFRDNLKIKMDESYNEFLNNYLAPSKINKKDEVNAILTMLIIAKPYFNTNSTGTQPKVTYFSYLSSKCKNFINTKEFVKMGDLRINIEFSIDYNLNYKAGYFKISNILFMNQKFDINGNIDFEELITTENMPQEIKDFLIAKFKEDLENARKEYYSSNDKLERIEIKKILF